MKGCFSPSNVCLFLFPSAGVVLSGGLLQRVERRLPPRFRLLLSFASFACRSLHSFMLPSGRPGAGLLLKNSDHLVGLDTISYFHQHLIDPAVLSIGC